MDDVVIKLRAALAGYDAQYGRRPLAEQHPLLTRGHVRRVEAVVSAARAALARLEPSYRRAPTIPANVRTVPPTLAVLSILRAQTGCWITTADIARRLEVSPDDVATALGTILAMGVRLDHEFRDPVPWWRLR